jgi:hypothetical protein
VRESAWQNGLQACASAFSGTSTTVLCVCAATERHIKALMTTAVYPGPRGALVASWPCLRSYVAAFESTCNLLTTYAARHTRVMSNLCNAGVPVAVWQAALAQRCGIAQA